MMYGKHYQSMYTGSMVGKGSAFFALWGYVIAHMRADAIVGAQVEMNPTILSTILGEKREVICATIAEFCSPDPDSRSQEEEGRKLVQLGPFDYRVVNGKKYIEIRNEEDRREKNRDRQAKFREDHKSKKAGKKFSSKPLPFESAAQKLEKAGVPQDEIDRLSDASLPQKDDPDFPA
jgi:hypothetical protein